MQFIVVERIFRRGEGIGSNCDARINIFTQNVHGSPSSWWYISWREKKNIEYRYP